MQESKEWIKLIEAAIKAGPSVLCYSCMRLLDFKAYDEEAIFKRGEAQYQAKDSEKWKEVFLVLGGSANSDVRWSPGGLCI